MRWAHIVLYVQAIATLVLGTVFLLQVFSLDARNIAELKVEFSKGVVSEEVKVIDVKERYSAAAYILLVVSVMEVMILTRLSRTSFSA